MILLLDIQELLKHCSGLQDCAPLTHSSFSYCSAFTRFLLLVLRAVMAALGALTAPELLLMGSSSTLRACKL